MPGWLDWAVAEEALSGQRESGDRYLVAPTAGGMLIAVIDGLGHGAEAAEAAKLAVMSLERFGEQPIISLVQSCHRSLAGTRGVVLSVAGIDVRQETMTWVGVGNVEGLLLRAHGTVHPRREELLVRGGVVGVRLPALTASIVPLMPGDTLVFVTDGIGGDFVAVRPSQGEAPQQFANRVLRQWRTGTDDALVLVARYLGAQA